jgi:hypothetical protein
MDAAVRSFRTPARERTVSSHGMRLPVGIVPSRRNHPMKGFLLVAAVIVAVSPVRAADVGVSVSVGEPGFYGRIDIGNVPRPQVIYPQPVVIQPAPVEVERPPVYLRVPPGHAKNWRKHCRKYNACGERVFFVQDSWYNEVYVPHYRAERDEGNEHHDQGHGHGHGHGKKDD